MTTISNRVRYWGRLIAFGISLLILATPGMMIYLAYAHTMNLVHPVRRLPQDTLTELGLDTWEEVEFTAPDGIKLAGWYVPPAPKMDGAVIIIVHGLANNRAELVEGRLLAQEGFGILAFDLRNHGASGGDMTSFGFYERFDVQGAVNYLLSRPDVNPDRIGIFGLSLGAATTLLGAAQSPEIDAVAVAAAFTSLEENLDEGITGLTRLPPDLFRPLVVFFGERETGIQFEDVRPIDALVDIAPRPILFIQGRHDPLIKPRNAYDLYAAAHEPKQLLIVEDAGHGGYLASPQAEEYWNTLLTFYTQYLLSP